MKLVVACPTYGPVDPQAARHLRVAVMVAARDHTFLGDISPDRLHYSAARNIVAGNAVESEADGVIWVDSDILPPPGGITKLVRHGHDFVSGVYFQRHPPHFPLFGKNIGNDKFTWAAEWPPNVVAPMDGCGFGFVFTSVKMLQAILKKYKEPFEFTRNSEDLTFCLRAKECGFQLYVDTGVLCKHLGDALQIGEANFTSGKVYVGRVDTEAEREEGQGAGCAG